MIAILNKILPMYGIQTGECEVKPYGDGLINGTWKVIHENTAYILQQVNQSVFKSPFYIDHNLAVLKKYLSSKHADYLFISPLADQSGNTLIQLKEGYFRMFPFVINSHSLNVLKEKQEAFEAAKQFGKFSKLLNDFDVALLKITLPDFHNLSLRFDQFLLALKTASAERKHNSSALISFILGHEAIVATYKKIVATKAIPLRVIHHDTKINNVLFDKNHKGMCVIDLDTVMPGYFISDVGDMMRTYLSPANEEETDLKKIVVRDSFLKEIYDGYMDEMSSTLTVAEKKYFLYAGEFIIFMQAIRFLTDYLQNDIYYGAKYDGHNLNRAANQLTLLKRYMEAEEMISSDLL